MPNYAPPMTPDEEKAVKALVRALNKLPPHLGLFAASGTLCVVREKLYDVDCFKPLAVLDGIHADGGDPEWDNVNADTVPHFDIERS